MPIRNETPTRFMDEVRIISPWAFFFALLAFLATVVGLPVVTQMDKNPTPPLVLIVPLSIVAGTIFACYILLVGYINRDAARRGMSRLLWTLIAIFIPNALGIVLYFILRKPRIASCPQCSAVVEPGFGFCPRCRYRLSPVCPHCQRGVNAGDKFCPFCGGDLGAGVNAVSAEVPDQTLG
ncbi:MAG: zinc ribbon domain-containing protein [Terriglobales bacterium]|jgi:RNA polymerase subunit RPABC4/transcription elongation factor Spt4